MKPAKNQSGQMIVEMVLILTFLLSVTLFAARYFKDNAMVASLISGPWTHLSGMIQNGVWKPSGVAELYHPNHHARHSSLLGKSAK